MRRQAALLIAIALAISGCQSTSYKISGEDRDIRFGSRRTTEKLVRHVSKNIHLSYFVLGLVPIKKDLDLAKEIGLQPGEALVNARITNEIDSLDMLINSAMALTVIGPLIWQIRSHRIEGDIVQTSQSETTAVSPDTSQPTTKIESETPAAEPPQKAQNFQLLKMKASHGKATAACAKVSGRLPTRSELKDWGAKNNRQAAKGDFWTNEAEDQDAWAIDIQSGASFLNDQSSQLGVLCAIAP